MNRMFSAVAEPVPITQVLAPGPDGGEFSCEVTGWSADGTCEAYAVGVEDSGEGQVLLIFGGNQGIRLRPAGSTGSWSLTDQTQWGEPCLLLDRAAPYTLRSTVTGQKG